MTSSYPGALDNLTNPVVGDKLGTSTPVHSSQHIEANDAIDAIQLTLGINPQGDAADVVERLDKMIAKAWILLN